MDSNLDVHRHPKLIDKLPLYFELSHE